MAKRNFKTFFVCVLGNLIITIFLISCNPGRFQGSSVITAVPQSSPLFIKVNDAVEMGQVLGKENEWWKLLGNIDKIKPLNKIVFSVDSIINAEPDLKKIIKGKEIVFSLNPGGRDVINVLAIMPIDISSDQKIVENIIEKFIEKRQLHVNKRKYDKAYIYELTSDDPNEFTFSYSFCKNFFIISPKPFLIEESIRQLDFNSKIEDHELATLLKTIDNQAGLNIFINHKTAGEMLSIVLSDLMKTKASLLKNYSQWTELDAIIQDEKIILSGFTKGDLQDNYFSNILIHQQPGISEIESVLPSNINFFSGFFLSDIEQFFKDYQSYLNLTNLLPQNQKRLNDIENATGFNLKNMFVEIFDKEIAVSGNSIDPSTNNLFKVLTIKTKSGSFALKKMRDFQEAYVRSMKNSSTEWERDFTIDNQTSMTFYKFPVEDMAGLLFGNIFANIKTCWFTVFDNYLIFSDSYYALGKTILSNILGETLIDDSDYKKFQSGLTSKNNFYFFCNSSIAFTESNIFFSNDISKNISSNTDFGKFKYIAWQVSTSGDMIYNNACIYYNPNMELKPKPVWQSHISSPLTQKPMIVENRFDRQDFGIILTAANNNLYLLNNVGRIVFQINVGSPILCSPQLIDYYKNGEYQLVFNTREKLFIIDKWGKNLNNFPVNFRVNATNGVSVFDYEKTKNYRFFVASEDKYIYAYDTEGQLLEGWQPYKTDHEVFQPVQHFSVEGKDYIVATDQMKDYILDRKGNIRVQTEIVYQHSKNNTIYLEKRTSSNEPRLVTTDFKGNIHRTYFNGSHETIEFNQLDDTHYFLADNADDDEDNEYLFVQGNHIIVQKKNGRNVFNIKIDCDITGMPSVFNFSSDVKKVGVTCSASNKIYLFNTNGSIFQGFPLDGSSEFNIGFINDDQSNINVLVGSPDGYLFNYLVGNPSTIQRKKTR